MSELNVCLINDSFPPEIDGVANAVTNYAEIISSRHGRTTVVTPDNPEADDSVYGFPVLRYPSVDLTRLVGYYAGFPFSPEVQKRLEGEGFDIIHSHCPISSTLLARSLRDRINVPVVMTYHTKFDIDIANAISGKLLQEEAKRILVRNISACDEVWTVSRGAGENLRSLGYEGDYIVMPNGVDFPQGRVGDDLIEEVTGAYDLPADLPVFLFIGRMMWYKGIRIILDALKLLRETGQGFRMVFVGGGGDREEIVAYTEELGLRDVVTFVEPIHDRSRIRAWYCRADLFLFPSTFDTNGLVVREAAACGLPSVLIAGSCAAEDAEDGVSGFLVEENAQSMAAKLTEICRNPELLKTVGEGAERDLYLSWEDAVAGACRRYEDVIDNYRRGLYGTHEGLSDDFIHSIAASMASYNRSVEKRRTMIRDLQKNYHELIAEIRAEQARRLSEQARVAEELRSREQQMVEGFLAEQTRRREALQNEHARFVEEIRSREQQLRARFDDLSRYWDRFM